LDKIFKEDERMEVKNSIKLITDYERESYEKKLEEERMDHID